MSTLVALSGIFNVALGSVPQSSLNRDDALDEHEISQFKPLSSNNRTTVPQVRLRRKSVVSLRIKMKTAVVAAIKLRATFRPINPDLPRGIRSLRPGKKFINQRVTQKCPRMRAHPINHDHSSELLHPPVESAQKSRPFD
jgi:hypothetical protein